jgi:DNA-binding transcriptional ArsR family regulator
VHQVEKLARIFKVLSVPARLRIVQLLRGGPLCVGAVSVRLGVTQGAVSQHLRLLRDAGLVTPEKRGYYVHYRVNETILARWNGTIDNFLKAKGKRLCLPDQVTFKTTGGQQCVRPRKDAKSRRS